jgi:hypothetical protein
LRSSVIAHPVGLAYRQHLAFGAAVEDRIGRLLGAKARQASAFRHPLSFHDLGCRERRRSDRPDLAGAHQIGEGRQGLLDVGLGRGPIDDLLRLAALYLSAVSMKLMPKSKALWMMRMQSSWSGLPGPPNIIAPKQ